MARPQIKIGVRVTQYDAVRTLGQTVVLSMTGNLSFPTPSPLLATLQSAVTALSNAIAAWGPAGNRGTHEDLINLRAASFTLRNLLLQEAAYVYNQVDPTADYLTQAAFILSSGFQVKNSPVPQGALGAPQNVHQMFAPNVPIFKFKIKWKKPLGLSSPNNCKSYIIMRSLTDDVNAAVQVGTSTKTSFIDNPPFVSGLTYWYFVAGNNDSSTGVFSSGLGCTLPV